MANLKPPKNYRQTTPKCCATCQHFIEVEVKQKGCDSASFWRECERDGSGQMCQEDYFWVCDYYKSENPH